MESNNTKAMREALERLINLAYEVQDLNSECEDGPKTSVPTQFIIDVAKSALAAPPRNCDVGTVAEQCDRHLAICLKHAGCATCPRNRKNISYKECVLSWAQEPYTEDNPQ